MSLEDKIINPMAPAELPGQRSDPLPKAGKKRRKSGGAAAAKVRNSDLEDEVGGDNTAVLTLGTGGEPRRPQKKMLFESASDGAALSFAGPAIRQETPRAPVAPPAVAPAAAVKAPKPVPAEPAPAPIAAKTDEIAPPAPAEAPVIETNSAPEAPAPKSENKDAAAIAALKAPVFQVSALAMREPEPQPEPEPKDEAQPELPLAVEAATDTIAEAAQDAAEPAAEEEESVDESLTLAFDATLADGLAERTAAAPEEVESEPAAPAPSFTAEPAALHTPEPPPAPPVPEPPPAPAYVAPAAAEAPKPEPKPESETPSRGLSRSEAIAARLSARATSRPAPTAAETLAAARTAQQQLRSADLPKNPGDIYGYWTRVKNGRRFPSRADFDAEQVAENWPNSMLLTCGNGIGAGTHGNFSSVLRLGANRRARPGEDLNFTSMITEWILATGGEAARAGAPVQDTEVFPTPDGTHAYKIVALPLSENQTRVDHVLCHLSRS
jgi:hypothetical protein